MIPHSKQGFHARSQETLAHSRFGSPTQYPRHPNTSDPSQTRSAPTSGHLRLVTTYNEEHNIRNCLASLSWCDDILVVDSFSTDATPEIARRYPKVRFVQRTYYGGAAQKNWAMRQVAGDWILILDADERCSPELRDEILDLLATGPKQDVYAIHRRVFFLGNPIRHCGFDNDRVVRLMRRGVARYQNRRVHARVVVNGGDPALNTTQLLCNSLDHFMVRSYVEYQQRMIRYGHWGAAQAWRDGCRTNALKAWVRTTWRFLRTYIVQGGFLDGKAGLLFCSLQTIGTFSKWSTVLAWQYQVARGISPDLPPFEDDGINAETRPIEISVETGAARLAIGAERKSLNQRANHAESRRALEPKRFL